MFFKSGNFALNFSKHIFLTDPDLEFWIRVVSRSGSGSESAKSVAALLYMYIQFFHQLSDSFPSLHLLRQVPTKRQVIKVLVQSRYSSHRSTHSSRRSSQLSQYKFKHQFEDENRYDNGKLLYVCVRVCVCEHSAGRYVSTIPPRKGPPRWSAWFRF